MTAPVQFGGEADLVQHLLNTLPGLRTKAGKVNIPQLRREFNAAVSQAAARGVQPELRYKTLQQLKHYLDMLDKRACAARVMEGFLEDVKRVRALLRSSNPCDAMEPTTRVKKARPGVPA